MLRPDSLDQLLAAVRRPASLAHVLRGRLDPLPIESLLGGVTVGRAGEAWPRDGSGQPMAGVAQLHVAAAPYCPPALRGIALVTIFLARDKDWLAVPDGPNGVGWLLRAYSGEEELGLIATPGSELRSRPRRITWSAHDDVPAWEDLVNLVDGDVLEEFLGGREPEDVIGSPEPGTKLGGWPTLIQSEITWPARTQADGGGAVSGPGTEVAFCLQVDSSEDAGLALWDGGVLHIGRMPGDGPPVWVAEAQFL